jgi:hypothetical protein
MTNRTVQILGVAYGSSPTSITAAWNGNQIFSGTVPTQNTPAPTYATSMADVTPGVLFTFEIPMDATGNIGMTTSIENNTVLLAEILANYCNVANVTGNVVTHTSSGPNGFYSISPPLTSDERSEVLIDGITQSIPNPKTEPGGTWWFIVPAGSTLSCNVDVQTGLE